MKRATLLARAYYRGLRGIQRLQDLQSAAYTGMWLAFLTEGLRTAIDTAYYDTQPEYVADKWNESGLFTWERAAVDQYFPVGSSVLVTSAGGGRELIALRRSGFDVAGCECHPELLRSGNGRLAGHGIDAPIRPAPRDECPDFGRSFDAAIVGWSSYTLIRGRERRIRFLRQLRSQVQTGAPILVSFFPRQGTRRPFSLAARVANAVGRLLRSGRIETGDYLAPNFAHFFLEDELASELASGGFELAVFRNTPDGHAVAYARDFNPSR
jgi:hypothetical protein